MLTPYQYASNRPIDGIDLDGLEWSPYQNYHTYKFMDGFGTSIAKGTWNTISYAVNNSNFAGYGYSPDMKPPTEAEIAQYRINWSQQLDPYYQARNFAESSVLTVQGVYQFGEGIYEGDGEKTAQSLPAAISAVATLYSGQSFFKSFLRSPSKYNSRFLRNRNVHIWSDAEATRYLDRQGASAAYMTGEDGVGTIILRKNATIQEVTEEIIHHNQTLMYGEKYMIKNRNLIEIEAQDELLRIGKSEGWSDVEINKIKDAKKYWQEKLDNQNGSSRGTSSTGG